MKSQPMLLWVILSLFVSLPGRSAAKPSSGKILSLGVSESGNLSKLLTDALGAALIGHETVAGAETLPSQARACRQQACLMALAESYHVAQIIGAEVSSSPDEGQTETLRKLDLFLYDHVRQVSGTESGFCPAEELSDCLTTLATRLLHPTRSPAAIWELSTPGDLLVDLQRIRRERSTPYPVWRISLATGLGVVFLTSLASAITVHSMHHQPTEGICDDAPDLTTQPKNVTCAWNLKVLMAAGYTLAGTSAIGFGLTLGLPGWRP